MTTLQEFIKTHVKTVEPIAKASQIAWWNLATTGDPQFAEQLKQANISLRKIYSSKQDYDFLNSVDRPTDPLLSRQLTLLLNEYRENQIPAEKIEEIVKLESEIESIYTNFRALINGKEVGNNDIKDLFLKSPDSNERKQVWEASKSIGEQVEKKVLTLIKRRNEAAKTAGFSDYYTMRLQLQELDETDLFKLLAQIENLTNDLWNHYKGQLDLTLSKRFTVQPSELMPWHYQDPFFQEAPQQDLDLDRFYKGKDVAAISQEFYRAIGLPVEDIMARSDLYEKEKKNQHAFCNCMDRKEDVRILCNLRDNEYWMGTQLHELGHAVYDKFIDQNLPYLLRIPAHTSTTEAIAMLFGRLSKSGIFLQQYCGVAKEEADRIDSLAKRQLASNLLVFVRWTLVMIHFERDMYQKPTEDLNALWWDYVERFQGVNRVPGRDKPDWAAKLHLACAPVYYQNYLLGEMTASQLDHYFEDYQLLRPKLFELGAKFSWNQTLEQATGELLNPHYFVEDIKKGFQDFRVL